MILMLIKDFQEVLSTEPQIVINKPYMHGTVKWGKDKVDKGRGGKTISGPGPAWSLFGKNGKENGRNVICGSPMILSI